MWRHTKMLFDLSIDNYKLESMYTKSSIYTRSMHENLNTLIKGNYQKKLLTIPLRTGSNMSRNFSAVNKLLKFRCG